MNVRELIYIFMDIYHLAHCIPLLCGNDRHLMLINIHMSVSVHKLNDTLCIYVELLQSFTIQVKRTLSALIIIEENV